jgi:hypothetical protein
MSGGGIWAFPLPRPNQLWTPQLRLIAVIRASRYGEWIRGTRIHRWLKMIADEIPALAVEISKREV